MPRYTHTDTLLNEEQITERIAPCALKFAWFMQHKYVPHYFQSLFHSMWGGDDPSLGLARYRHLVAGRRGGKTLSAAWEVAYYVLHPREFHWDAHRKESTKPLTVWVVTKDFPTGHAALTAFREVLAAAGLEQGKDYKENRGNHWFEFENGSFVHFRSAEDPQSLRGAGLDILWMDEAAFIPNKEAWNVSRPALSDKLGIYISTTTPDGKNWLYDEFWSPKSLNDPSHGRVEYRSIDNPYFPAEEWLYLLEHYHPLLFKQEYMAAFDSMAGKELPGEWLKYYVLGEPEPGSNDIRIPRNKDNPDLYDLETYIGVDPAISLSDDADRFAITLVGKTRDNTQAFILEQWAGRIPFPEQVDKIQEWNLQYRPQYIAVEATAYQRALEQQVNRLEGFPAVAAIFATGKKSERILSMAPLFKIGKVRIRRDQADFINEWLDYDSTRKNPKDDCLDSVEIALRAAGVMLPRMPDSRNWEPPAADMEELAARLRPKASSDDEFPNGYDEHLGGDW